MWNVNDHSCQEQPRRFRMVCHKCGAQGPEGALGVICNCRKPDLHQHCLYHPCDKCREPGVA